MTLLGILVGLLVLSFLVTIHELGHALAARRNGVVVEEFAIGFPPTAWSKKLKSGVKLMINWVLLGGYVKLQGEYDAADQPGDYGNAKFLAKTKILFAGVAMNLLLAWLIFTILAISGLPKVLPNQVSFDGDLVIASPVFIQDLETDGPAAQAGVKANDEVISVAGQLISSPQELIDQTKKLAGQTVEFKLRRQGEELSEAVSLRGEDKPVNKGFSGIYPRQETIIKTRWYQAPTLGFATTVQFVGETFKGIGQILANFFGGLVQKLSFNTATRQQGSANLAKAGESVAGPLQLVGVIFPALVSADLTIFLFFTALISLTLAVMNSLPIPGLDGGRWLVTTIFKLLKKPLTKEREEKIQGTGMLILLILTIVVIISDVTKIF